MVILAINDEYIYDIFNENTPLLGECRVLDLSLNHVFVLTWRLAKCSNCRIKYFVRTIQ